MNIVCLYQIQYALMDLSCQ